MQLVLWSLAMAASVSLATSFVLPASPAAFSLSTPTPTTYSSSSNTLYPPRQMTRRIRTRTATRRWGALYSSLDDDPELLDSSEEGEEGGISYAPRSDADFSSESEQAAMANEAVATAVATRTGTANIELPTEIANSFLQYALSIILGRAIPDARDGLKPVHRRILYAMHGLQLSPASSHRKCARVVGEVLGKFHPHGDMAVYDALVRLAQPFSTRLPLIDGHGNFGSVDADPAAAMRYTECRLTKVATVLLQDLNSDTVDFVPNFDGNEVEPTVLPARLPVLLLNGASGIAVGMATNIPPHNLREIMAACTALVEGRLSDTEISDELLFSLVPAPDFPTGALLMESNQGAKQLYQTGQGGVVMRATTHMETLVTKKSTRQAIIVTELPYQVNKAALLEKMAGLVNDKKLDGIADLRDESDRDGIRMVIELKRDAVEAVVLNNLYKKTALQTTFSGNFLALLHGNDPTASLVPQRFTLRQALDCFLDFRFTTIRRKSAFELAKVQARAHIVQGLLLALEKADAVIEMVRSASDTASARAAVSKALGTSERQTEAILSLQLGQLTRMNKGKLTKEQATLEESKKELDTLLTVDSAVYKFLVAEFAELAETYGDDRRTRIVKDHDGDVAEIDLVRNSRSVIVVTRGGYIKRMPLKTFERQGRGTRGKRGTSDVGGGETSSQIAHCFTCHDHDTLLMVTQAGIAYGLRAYQVPIASRTAKGQPIPAVLPVQANDVITAVLPVAEFKHDEYVVLVTEQGSIKKTALEAFSKLTSRGLTIASLQKGDRLQWCQRCSDGDDILIGTAMGMATRFEARKLRATGRTSGGVRAIKLKEGDVVADMNVIGQENGQVYNTLIVTANGFGKRVGTDEFRVQARGGVGLIAIKFKGNQDGDRVSCLRTVAEDDEILLTTAMGLIVRQRVSEIPSQSRTATGVTIQKLSEGDRISTVSLVPEIDEQDEDEVTK